MRSNGANCWSVSRFRALSTNWRFFLGVMSHALMGTPIYKMHILTNICCFALTFRNIFCQDYTLGLWPRLDFLTGHHTSNLDNFWTCYHKHVYAIRGHFLGYFYPLTVPKTGRQNNFCRKAKLLVHTLLTSHHTSYLDHFWAHYQLFLYACTPFFYIYVLKGAFWGSFTP